MQKVCKICIKTGQPMCFGIGYLFVRWDLYRWMEYIRHDPPILQVCESIKKYACCNNETDQIVITCRFWLAIYNP